MTQEEYEVKVQSIPHELQKTFREALEIPLSKRIVNRFMGVVLKAYAEGQRDAQKESQDGAYMRGAEDMLKAMKIMADMEPSQMQKYFPQEYSSDANGFLMAPYSGNAEEILKTIDKYQSDQQMEKNEREKASVKAMADEIGIDKLLQLAGEIKSETANWVSF